MYLVPHYVAVYLYLVVVVVPFPFVRKPPPVLFRIGTGNPQRESQLYLGQMVAYVIYKIVLYRLLLTVYLRVLAVNPQLLYSRRALAGTYFHYTLRLFFAANVLILVNFRVEHPTK